ncbi:ferulic acid esterase [Bisporella sp. PMI_857]|nr:ferulic acid esterase [Bisporella sp. PMI_857]
MVTTRFFTSILLSLLFLQATAATFEDSCSQIRKKVLTNIPGSKVNKLEYYQAGSIIDVSDLNATCLAFGTNTTQIAPADLCRLALYVSTSPKSGIILETWLPRDWTGRFLSTGNGALGGCLTYEALTYATGLGFAAVSANGGHNGTSGGSWLNNPEGVHTGTVVGKKITKLFYGSAHKKSYYFACSTGGRQGFQSVQMYPKDFDGVVAGSPAFDSNALGSKGAFAALTVGLDPSDPGFITTDKWALVNSEILKQCDGLDGAVDGIIEDPDKCIPNISNLLCSNNTVNCLNAEQLRRATALLGPFLGTSGELIYPRMQPGAEIGASFIYYSSIPAQTTVDWFRYVIFSNASWDIATFTAKDAEFAISLDPARVSSFSPSLKAFKAAGGKLLHFHGMEDFVISSDNSERYWKMVNATMGNPDSFYRYFRIGGMQHCSGGPGAWGIGQIGDKAPSQDPQRNVLLGIVDWVENGKAPNAVIGTKYVNNTPSLGVEFTRNHCMFPASNKYIGPGPSTDPAAWKCS